MAIYEFGSAFTFAEIPRGTAAGVAGVTIPKSMLGQLASQTSNDEAKVANLWEEHRVVPYDIEEFLYPGFRYLDEAMKNYWSDIRVPSKDGYRFIRTKVAGMRTSLEVWTEDLKHGRVKLPVMSISRGPHKFNPNKFSPPYHPIAYRFLNARRTKSAGIFRPAPYNVGYTLSIWAESKRDAEYVVYQVATRFNPLAEILVNDGHVTCPVQMKDYSGNDVSDKEATAEQYAKIKYEATYTAEAFLSLPERVMPTILGTTQVIGERTVNGVESYFSNRG